jgi:DNA mismatch endonuclease, patch repair protein
MDKVSPETRSRMMAGIRGKDTEPERLLRATLFARGYRYRINSPDLPGKPDIKLTKHRAAIFVHGCFWHGHDCRYFRPPASNSGFWKEKIVRNRERDLRNLEELRAAGWRVCVVWECLIRSRAFRERQSDLIDVLADWIEGQAPFLELFGAESPGSMGRGGATIRYADAGENADEALFAAERRRGYS